MFVVIFILALLAVCIFGFAYGAAPEDYSHWQGSGNGGIW